MSTTRICLFLVLLEQLYQMNEYSHSEVETVDIPAVDMSRLLYLCFLYIFSNSSLYGYDIKIKSYLQRLLDIIVLIYIVLVFKINLQKRSRFKALNFYCKLLCSTIETINLYLYYMIVVVS